MGFMVAIISLLMAGFCLLRWLRSDIGAWYQGRELGLGLSEIALSAIAFLAAQALARQPANQTAAR